MINNARAQRMLEILSEMLVDQLDESLLDEVANLEYRVCMLELFGGVTE